MRKLFSVLLALVLAFVPINEAVYGEYHYTHQQQQIVQVIDYDWVDYDDAWWALMSDYGISKQAITDILQEHYMMGDCQFEYALYLWSEEPNCIAIFKFPKSFAIYNYMCCVMLGDCGKQYVFWNHADEDGTVRFEWHDVEPDVYCTFIFSGWKFN